MSKLFKRILSLFTVLVFVIGFASPTLADTIVGPGSDKMIYPLTAGQNINVGNVTVWNNSTTLYVQYNTIDDWYMKENQLDVYAAAPTTHEAPGQLTYKRSGELLQTYLVEIPLENFKNDTELYIVAHTTVIKDGVKGETAWGGDIKGTGGAWYYYIKYKVQNLGTIIVQKNIKGGPAQQGVHFKLSNNDNTIELNGITDSNGQITFNNLPSGSYKLYEIVPEGYETDLKDENRTIILQEGASVTKQVINAEKPSTIIVKKTIGIESGTPKAGVEFTLTMGDNKTTRLTGPDGLIKFENLKAGTYTLSENVPVEYNTSLNDTNNQITVKPGETITKNVVNTLKPANLVIQKNIGGTGAPQKGVEFILTNGSVTLNGFTNAEGIYEFKGLIPGTYSLSEIVPKGYSSSLNQDNNSITLTTGETLTFQVINTFNTPPAPEHGNVIIQKNIGSKTGAPQENVEFTLSNGKSQPLTGKTDTNGQLKFENLDPGTYTITETVPQGYTTDLPVNCTVEVIAGETTYKQVINIQKPSSILVKKTIGNTGDPQKDVVFTLTNGQDEFEGKTNEKGEILFDNLISGTYTLSETVPEYYNTNLNDSNNKITVKPGETFTKYVVNTLKTASITVQKNIDTIDGDPQADVTFTLTNGTVNLTAVTNKSGQAKFENLTPGTYILYEIVPDGYTTDLNDSNNSITVNPGDEKIMQVINTADIPDDPPPEGPTDLPSIKIVKTINKTTSKAGDTVKYTIAVTNDGNVDLTNIKVKDEMIGLDETISELKVGKTERFAKSYVIPEDTPTGDLKNVASAAVLYDDEIIEKSDDAIVEILEDIQDEDPPYGPTLPQTGGVSADMFYMAGGLIILAGLSMFKKRR